MTESSTSRNSYRAELAEIIERHLAGQRAVPKGWQRSVPLYQSDWDHILSALRSTSPGPDSQEIIEKCAQICDGYARLSRVEAETANETGSDEIWDYERAQAEAAEELAQSIRSLKSSPSATHSQHSEDK